VWKGCCSFNAGGPQTALITDCGSISPVLLATGLVSGKGQTMTHTKLTPLNRLPNILSQVNMSVTHTSVPNLVQIRPHRGLLCKWVKNNKRSFYLHTDFLETAIQVRILDELSHVLKQTIHNHSRMCL